MRLIDADELRGSQIPFVPLLPSGRNEVSDSDYCSRGERHSNQFDNVKLKVLP